MKKTYILPTLAVVKELEQSILAGSIHVDVDPTKSTDDNLAPSNEWDNIW